MRKTWIGAVCAAAWATSVVTGLAAAEQPRQAPEANINTRVDPQNVHAEGGAHLTNDRAARIAETLIATSGTANINVNVVDFKIGAPAPGDVNLIPLPPPIVDLVPEYRGYNYALANDRIAIVQPSTRNVVEVIDMGGSVAKKGGE
jgi:hypothetical protein